MRKVFGVVVAVLLVAATANAQQALTEKDRAEIQELTTKYAKALGSCAAEDYADVFVPDTGYFASNIRGEVVGRERLMALVQSERHCIPSAAPAPFRFSEIAWAELMASFTAPRSRGPPRPSASLASARARSGAALSSSRSI